MRQLFMDWEAGLMLWLGNEQAKVVHHSLSLEVCVNTFIKKNIVRVHLHAYVDNRAHTFVSLPENIQFRGCGVVLEKAQTDKRNKACALDQGHYYLQSPKIGSVYSKTNREAYEAFKVNAEWINDQWRKQVMTDGDAISEHVRCGQNSKFHVENIEFVARHKKRQRLKELIERKKLILQRDHQTFRIPPEVDRWRTQYTGRMRDRYKILILYGPSRTGKSMFVHWLIPGILEINCSGNVQFPDLTEYDHEEIPGVFFDEARLQLITSQKKLFQSINYPVKLGQTCSGKYAYDVYTHEKMLVVANNTFVEDYAKLKPCDREWIDDNTLPVFIKRNDLYDQDSP